MITTATAEVAPTDDRARRIVDAAAARASRGGYDAVLMRAVAADAGVALATVYRHFPSKVHLLVAVLDRELDRTEDRLDRSILRGDTPYQRVMRTTNLLTRALQRDPRLTEAMTRAVLFADAAAAAQVDAVLRRLDRLLADAMGNDHAGESAEVAIARLLGDVWLANLASWATGRRSAEELARRLDLAVHLALRDSPGET